MWSEEDGCLERRDKREDHSGPKVSLESVEVVWTIMHSTSGDMLWNL